MNKNVQLEIITKKISKRFRLDLEKYQQQYSKVELRESNEFHDRFLIIDDELVYHFGASLKDLAKKCFALNKLDKKVSELLIDHLDKIRKSNE